MNPVELSREDSTFKFPFTDKEDADMQLSKSYEKFREGLASRTPKSNEGSSSELGLALSPIARDRESTASIMEYLEGDTLSLDSVDSPDIEPNLPQEPTNEQEIAVPATENLEVTMKQVGQRSNAFIDQMRDAANKRKAAVTRSRDSLVAKEKEQLRSIAECESRFETLKLKLQSAVDFDKENQTFRRNKKHHKGFGGVGVPKIDKKPNTKPMSPKLGLRRNGTRTKSTKKPKGLSNGVSAFRRIGKSSNITIYDEKESTNEKPCKPGSPEKRNTARRKSIEVQQIFSKSKANRPKESSFEEHGAFKARPVPFSTTQRWNAGQLGIPKVAKRATTVPVSPCLGPKRKSRIVAERSNKIVEKQLKSKPKINASERSGSSGSSRSIPMTPASAKSSPLLGLDFIHSTRTESTLESDIEPMAQKRNTRIEPIFLRSTARGNRRKEYDIYRVEKHALMIQEKREELQSQIKELHRELKILSREI